MDYWIYFALAAAAIAIYAMVDISMRRFPLNRKLIWFPIVVLIPFFGPLAYYIKRKSMIRNIKAENEA